jgi:hypothetical protein
MNSIECNYLALSHAKESQEIQLPRGQNRVYKHYFKRFHMAQSKRVVETPAD